MVWKGLISKIGRFVKGRIAAARAGDDSGGIPDACQYLYPPLLNSERGNDGKILVVFYSGDGGWANLTSQLATIWQQAGIGVVGIDCMQYFWQEKEPDLAAEELSALIGKFAERWRAEKVIIVGYSMGADVLPPIVRRLEAPVVARMKRLVLISPSHHAVLKFRFIGWLGSLVPEGEGHALLPDLEEVAKILPISCYAGETERDSLASSLPGDIASVKFLPGGHHFGGDYESLAESILGELLDEF